MGGWLALLGIDPFSLIGKFLNGLAVLLPYLLIAGLVIGAFFYGQSTGKTICNNDVLTKELHDKDIIIKNQKDQMAALQIDLANYQGQLKADKDLINSLEGKIPSVVVDNRACDGGKPLIDILNKARQ